MAQYLHCGFVCLKDIIPEVSQFLHVQLFKPKSCCHVVLERGGKPSKQGIIFGF